MRRLGRIVSCFSLLCASCVPSLTQKPAREANRTTPKNFEGSQDTSNSAQAKWREFFNDPNLNALIASALQNNQELNIQLQETFMANNEVLANRGSYMPRVDFRAGGGLEKVSRYTSKGAADELTGVPEPLQDYMFGFLASWEVDVWKKMRNATKAATFRYLATLEGRNFIITRLVAEIANSYYELMALDNQLEVLDSNIAIQQSALEVVKLQKEAARVTELAVQRFEAEVFKNKSRRYDILQRIVETENKLNFLAGRFPQTLARSSKSFNDLLPKAISAGLPSQLLQNRPDVTRAELKLAAAKLDVQVAKAYFYPSFGMRAGIGYQAFRIKRLINTPESLLYNVSADLMAPLINRNEIKAVYFSANSKQLQAVYEYEKTILNAYTEVANQLSMIDNLNKSFALQTQQVQKLTSSIDISTSLFTSARADYMEVLLTRRDALESQMELIETKKRQLAAVVNLYQALGGGWRR